MHPKGGRDGWVQGGGLKDRPPNAWIRWDRIRPDYESGMPAKLCAKRENVRLATEGTRRLVKAKAIRDKAYFEAWTRPWERLRR